MQVNEIFTSLSGECDGFGTQGGLATFVRLQKCNLDCTWCDTQNARCSGGEEMSVDEVAAQCTSKHVIITGGEPLLQLEEVDRLINILCPMGRKVHIITIETNGSIPILINQARSRYETLRFVVDYKLDSSGMSMSMKPDVFANLYTQDVIKFVLKDLQDYRQALALIITNPAWQARKIFSPIVGITSWKRSRYAPKWPVHLAQQMVKDKLEGVTFSLQWHKLLDLK